MANLLQTPAPAGPSTGGLLRMKVCCTDEKFCKLERSYVRVKKGKDGIVYIMDPRTLSALFTIETKSNKLRVKKVLKEGTESSVLLNTKRPKVSFLPSPPITIHSGAHSEREVGKLSVANTPASLKLSLTFQDVLSKKFHAISVKHLNTEVKEDDLGLVYLKEGTRRTQLCRFYKVKDESSAFGARVELEICAGVDAALIVFLVVLMLEEMDTPKKAPFTRTF